MSTEDNTPSSSLFDINKKMNVSFGEKKFFNCLLWYKLFIFSVASLFFFPAYLS